MLFPRRQFLNGAIASALAAPLISAQAEIQFGYDTATWIDQADQAVSEISELGYRGIQLSSSMYAKHAQQAADFKALLLTKKLTLVALAAGDATLNTATMKQEITDFASKAKWVGEVSGKYLQVTDNARPTTSKSMLDAYPKLGKHLTEIGKRILGDQGIKLAYRNQISGLGAQRNEIDRIMDATDPKYVWLSPDLAHLHTVNGDELRFVRDYLNRLAYPHFNDVRLHQPASATLDGSRVAAKFEFIELGQGKVNAGAVFQIMKDYRYQGWIMVELSRALKGRTPKESALINKRFIEEKLKQRF
jgi:inosose dehydratase